MKLRQVHSELRENVATYDGRRTAVTEPLMARNIIRDIIGAEAVEVFGVLLLDARARPIGWHVASRGTVSNTLIHPREVFGAALRLGAHSVILAHNHPSGDPEPSIEDAKVTDTLRKAGALLGVLVRDHIIVTAGPEFVSIRKTRHWSLEI